MHVLWYVVCGKPDNIFSLHLPSSLSCPAPHPSTVLRPQLKRADLETLKEGESLSFGGKEIEISHEISNVDYSTGKCFLGTCSSAPAAAAQLAIPIVQSSFKAPGGGGGGGRAGGKRLAKPVQRRSKPLHNPLSYGAVVLPKPPAGRSKIVDPVDVIIDPFLGQHLRQHQRAGVTFLYECVMGYREMQGSGAILADEMGLGKTLQTIATLWTLLRQGTSTCVYALRVIKP